MWWWRRILGGIAVLVALVVVWVGTAWGLMRASAQVDDAAPSDAVVVLGAGVWPNAVPSPALRARTEHGVRVWRATGSRYLLLTGGAVTDSTPEAVVMARLARQMGVPESALILEDRARNTAENAHGSARIARERGWRRVTVVSDPWHLYRARALFRGAGVPEVRQSPAYDSPNWTDSKLRRKRMARECVSLAFYLLGRR